MATNNTWDSAGSTDGSQDGNWALGHVPDEAEIAYFDGTSSVNCVFHTENIDVAGINAVAAYGGDIDMYDGMVHLIGEDGIVLDHGAGFDLGQGTGITLHGPLDFLHAGTFTDGTSSVAHYGTNDLISKGPTSPLYNYTVASGAVITIPAASSNLRVANELTVGGTLSVASGKQCQAHGDCDTVLGDFGTITGGGWFYLYYPGNGHGLKTFPAGATIDVTNLRIRRPVSGSLFAAGTYDSAEVKFWVQTAFASIIELNGTYVFAGNVEYESTNAGGSLTIDDSVHDPDVEYQGNLVYDIQNGSAITHTAGTGTQKLGGTADQVFTGGAVATPDLTIDKQTSGNVELVTVDLTLASIDMAGNFTATSGSVDTATSAALNIDGDFTVDNTFNAGDSTVWTIDGSLDNKDATWTWGSSSFVLTGTGKTVTGHYNSDFYDLTFAAGSSYTIHLNTGFRITTRNTLTINGTVVLDADDLATYASGEIVIGADAAISGSGKLYCMVSNSGRGITSCAASSIDANIDYFRVASGTRLAPLTTTGYFILNSDGGVSTVLKLDAAGDYAFGSLELESNHDSSPVTLDNSTNGPASITVNGNLTIDLNNAANIAIDDSGVGTNWTFTGDIVDQITGGGSFSWTPGTGTITFSGGSAQAIDGNMAGTVAATIIDKSGGTLTLGSNYTCASLTHTAGTLDPNGQTIETTGNLTISGGASIIAGADAMNDVAFTVGGDLHLAGTSPGSLLNLRAEAGHVATLTVTGTAKAFYCHMVNCPVSKASVAYGCTDGGGNTNWTFEDMLEVKRRGGLGLALADALG